MTAAWWGRAVLARLRFFGVQRVEVVGARYLEPGAVVAGLGLDAGASVWTDLGELEGRLEARGGVARVRVTRRLPGTLRVELTEIEPVALAQAADELVPVARDGRRLPYDPSAAPVDAPVVERLSAPLLSVLATIQATDLGLFAEISTARAVRKGEVVLELSGGPVRLGAPVAPEVVRSVSAVQRDLAQRGLRWRELDARFAGWVVVRRRANAVSGGG